MEYVAQPDDDKITSLRVPKRIRHKLGFCMHGNEYIDQALERILDEKLKLIPEPVPLS